MFKIKVYYTDYETKEDGCCTTLKNLKPRRYMCAWSFDKLLKYISEELYWNDIEKDLVDEIHIVCEQEQWVEIIARNK
jgi:hypothetical protein